MHEAVVTGWLFFRYLVIGGIHKCHNTASVKFMPRLLLYFCKKELVLDVGPNIKVS